MIIKAIVFLSLIQLINGQQRRQTKEISNSQTIAINEALINLYRSVNKLTESLNMQTKPQEMSIKHLKREMKLQSDECKRFGNKKVCSFNSVNRRGSSKKIVLILNDKNNKKQTFRTNRQKRQLQDNTANVLNSGNFIVKRDSLHFLNKENHRAKRFNTVNLITGKVNGGTFEGQANVIDMSSDSITQKCTPFGCVNIVG